MEKLDKDIIYVYLNGKPMIAKILSVLENLSEIRKHLNLPYTVSIMAMNKHFPIDYENEEQIPLARVLNQCKELYLEGEIEPDYFQKRVQRLAQRIGQSLAVSNTVSVSNT